MPTRQSSRTRNNQVPRHDCEGELQELRRSNVYEFVANSPKSTKAVPAHIRPMLKGTPAFPVRCKVRLSPITRKPARVKMFMPRRISLVSTRSYSSAGSKFRDVHARCPPPSDAREWYFPSVDFYRPFKGRASVASG